MARRQDSFKRYKLFSLLLESAGYKIMRSAFDKLFDRPIWWLSEKKGSKGSIKPLPRAQRARDMQDYLSLSDHKKAIIKAVRESERRKGFAVFNNPLNNTHGIAMPVLREGRIYGSLGLCGIKIKPKPGIPELLSGYVNCIIDEISKELELSRVYEMVRPRAIALSTVHTIHRLINSTLDIKELFPRIARLALQVLKAECASICMVDKKTCQLACVASVDYKKSKDLFKIKRRPSAAETRVAQSGRSILKKEILCIPMVDEDICGVISVRGKAGNDKFTIFDQEILTTLAEQSVIAIKNAQLYKEQEDLTIGTIKSLSHLLDVKFPRAYTHTEFFVELMLGLGKELGLDKKDLKRLQYSAILPDLGKLVVPEEILKKAKGLSGRERKIIKTHTVRGTEILKYLDVLKPILPIILHHHERFDGKGYPYRLKGGKIPLGSRIMAVADAFEAMICHRPYRKQLPFRMAVSEIRRQSGRQFGPEIVKAFMHIANNGKLEELIGRHREQLRKSF